MPRIKIRIQNSFLLGYVFLVEGRQNRKESKTRKEGTTFSLHSTKEWEDLWEVTSKENKNQEMSNAN